MKVLILTTATNRSDLHKKTFQSYKEFLDPSLDITWIINLDTVEGFGQHWSDSHNTILSIFEDRDINFIFIPHTDGWFNRAVRLLVYHAKIEDYSSFDCILYLEDDWLYESNHGVTFLDTFDFDMDGNEHRILKKRFVNLLSKRLQVGEVTLQPTIWTVRAFDRFVEVFEDVEDGNSCPETILESNYGKPPIRSQFPLFKDAGREWTKSKDLQKPPKKEVGKKNPNYKKNGRDI